MSQSDDWKRFLRDMVAVLLAGCAGVVVFHRATLLSGLDVVQADVGDSRLVVFLLEHWNRVFTGNAEWASPSMFYPVKGVLGYSDMLFGMGVPYTVFRNSGLNLFEAANATVVALSLLSYLSAYWFLRHILTMNQSGSIVGAFFFAFAYPKFAQLPHLQLRFDFFQPLALGAIAPLLLEDRSMHPRELSARTGVVDALLCLAASTAFYHTWFFVLFGGLSAIVAVSYRAVRTVVVMRLREARRVLWIPLVLCVVGLAPFFSIYVPAMRLATDRNWQNTIQYLPRASSYLWLGPEHLLWGGLAVNTSHDDVYEIENRLGVGVAATSIVCVGWIWAIRHCVRALRGRNQASGIREHLLSAVLVSSLIVTALTVRWGSFYPWKAVYALVPGASAMFAAGRWALTLTLPVSILIAAGSGCIERLAHGRRTLSTGVRLVVGLFIAVEQAGRIPAWYSGEVASRYHEELSHAIPASCEAFLLVPTFQSDEASFIAREDFDEAKYLAANPDVVKEWRGRAWDHYREYGYREGRRPDVDAAEMQLFQNFHYHLSAMIASTAAGKPTVNGASGLGPADYPLSNLYQKDIDQQLRVWMSRYPGRDACLVSKEISPDELTARGRRASFMGITLVN